MSDVSSAGHCHREGSKDREDLHDDECITNALWIAGQWDKQWQNEVEEESAVEEKGEGERNRIKKKRGVVI